MNKLSISQDQVSRDQEEAQGNTRDGSLDEKFESALREIGVDPSDVYTINSGPRRDIGLKKL